MGGRSGSRPSPFRTAVFTRVRGGLVEPWPNRSGVPSSARPRPANADPAHAQRLRRHPGRSHLRCHTARHLSDLATTSLRAVVREGSTSSIRPASTWSVAQLLHRAQSDRLQRLASPVVGAPDAYPPRRGRPGRGIPSTPSSRAAGAGVTRSLAAASGSGRGRLVAARVDRALRALVRRPSRGAMLLPIPPSSSRSPSSLRARVIAARRTRSGRWWRERALEAGARGRPRLCVRVAPACHGERVCNAGGALSGIVARGSARPEHLVFVPTFRTAAASVAPAAALGSSRLLGRPRGIVLFYCVSWPRLPPRSGVAALGPSPSPPASTRVRARLCDPL